MEHQMVFLCPLIAVIQVTNATKYPNVYIKYPNQVLISSKCLYTMSYHLILDYVCVFLVCETTFIFVTIVNNCNFTSLKTKAAVKWEVLNTVGKKSIPLAISDVLSTLILDREMKKTDHADLKTIKKRWQISRLKHSFSIWWIFQ